MRCPVAAPLAAVLAAAALLAPAPARAAPNAFCASLREAWTAVKRNDGAAARRALGDGWSCSTPEAPDIICVKEWPDPAAARAAYGALRAEALACMAPFGLKPSELAAIGPTNTVLDGPGDEPGIVLAPVATRSVSLIVASNSR